MGQNVDKKIFQNKLEVDFEADKGKTTIIMKLIAMIIIFY